MLQRLLVQGALQVAIASLDRQPHAMSDLEKFQKYIDANADSFIERLSKAVAIPSYVLSPHVEKATRSPLQGIMRRVLSQACLRNGRFYQV